VIPPPSADRAPIEYRAVRRAFHGVRGITAGVVAIVAILFALTGSAPYTIPYAIGAVIVVADALYRRTRGDSAAPSLFIDITAMGAAMVIGGASPSVQVAALAYGIAAIALLLPARQTGILMVYALGWAAVIMAMGGSGLKPALDRGAFDGFMTIVLLIDVAVLMSGATRNLLHTQNRQQELLEQERRSVAVKNEFVSMVSHELRTPITGISGSTSAEVDLPVYVRVWSDPVRLRQIVRNLVENARKYGGNEVYISGEERREGTYTVIVADNGSGVAEADQERIFEHFEQLSKGDARLEQGVGLGLPIARKLARAMGGELWYEDRFPVGAAFCFDVDMVKEPERSSAPIEVEVGADR
jgi:signal transduction histidine kinase